jgi:hypothetical protein
VDFLKKDLLANGYISEEDFNLFQIADDAAHAATIISRFYHRYHSLRYVSDRLVLRLAESLPPARVQALKVKFQGILRPGGDILPSAALAQESDEPQIKDLPRLIVDFNRRNFGGLKALIDELNRD